MPSQLRPTKMERRCCCCNRSEKTGSKDAKRINIIAISPYVYRRGGEGKGIVRGGGRVQVCEECFIRAMLPNPSDEYNIFTGQLFEHIRHCYSGIVEDQNG
jgi:hypothetical protein